jgi:hypothetical protein
VLKVLKVLENQKQLKDGKEQTIDKVASNSSHIANLSYALPNYIYTKESIDNFFYSDEIQQEQHKLEESVCRPLIGKRNSKPFFYFCKIDPKVENINLKSIEDHIRLKDSEIHKAKLLELIQKELKENND